MWRVSESAVKSWQTYCQYLLVRKVVWIATYLRLPSIALVIGHTDVVEEGVKVVDDRVNLLRQTTVHCEEVGGWCCQQRAKAMVPCEVRGM